MAHNIEINNGVASYVENGRKERAWHGLGQVYDGQISVREALELSHADYTVETKDVFAVTPAIQEAMEQSYVNEEKKFDSITQGHAAHKLQQAYNLLMAV